MRWFTPLLLVVCTAACGDPEDDRLRLVSGDHEVRVAADGATIEFSRDDRPLLRWHQDSFVVGLVDRLEDQLSYDPFWLVHEDELFTPDPPPSLRWREMTGSSAEETSDGIEISQSFGGAVDATLTITPSREGSFNVTWVPRSTAAIAWMRLRPRADPTEAFYGLGEFLDDVNQRGKLRPMQLEPDLSLESASNEQHVPVPLLIGTNGWGLFVESRRLGLFDVAREEDDLVEITYGTAEESDRGLTFHLFGAEHPLDVTHAYYQATSAPLLPARWAYGPLIWRDENRDQAEVEADIQMIRDLDLATSGIWIDRPYATAVNTFDFHAANYPDPAQMIARAHAAGLRMALWHTPYLEESTGALRAEALDRGFFPPRTGITLNNWSEPIDLTNADAYAWWQDLIRRYTAMGIEGFKLDYGEDLIGGVGGGRAAWSFADGSTELTMHHGYTLLYHQVYAETLPETGGFLLCRTGRWGDQKNVSVIWPGDLDADFSKHRERVEPADGSAYNAVGGLPASVIMGLTLGPSGFPFYGADTGGYRHSPPDNETFIRWFQQTALSTIMQVGDSSSQPPWLFTPDNGRTQETLDLYRIYARLHLRLFPYVWTYAEALSSNGRAIQRPLGLAHPELGQHPSDIYLLGDDLLVAPVLERGARQKRVLFPSGDWFDWWDLSKHAGEETVDAPLDRLPLYIRSGAIIPMLRPEIDTLSPATDPGVESFANDAGRLYVRIARGPPRSFRLFDGTLIEVEGDQINIIAGERFDQGMQLELIGFEVTETIVDVPAGDQTIQVR